MYKRLGQALDSGLFSPGLCELAQPPLKDDIAEFRNSIHLPLTYEHVKLLENYGGSLLDEIRINALREIRIDGQFVEFASDYNGFIFKYDTTGAVFAEDTDGGKIERLADSVGKFVNEILLGERGTSFYGEDWVNKLRKYGLV